MGLAVLRLYLINRWSWILRLCPENSRGQYFTQIMQEH